VDLTPEDGEEDLGLAHGATPRSTQEAVHPRSTHAPDQGKTAAEEEDFPSHAPRTSAAEKISPGQRTPRSRQSFTLTSLAPSLSINAMNSRRELLQARVVPSRPVAPQRSVAENGTEDSIHEK
jgi:hypothetical protein